MHMDLTVAPQLTFQLQRAIQRWENEGGAGCSDMRSRRQPEREQKRLDREYDRSTSTPSPDGAPPCEIVG